MFAILKAVWVMEFFQICIREVEVLRTCLCEYRYAPSLCVTDGGGCIGCTDVDEKYRVVDELGQRHGAVRGFSFYGWWSGPSVVDWV